MSAGLEFLRLIQLFRRLAGIPARLLARRSGAPPPVGERVARGKRYNAYV